MEKHFDQIMKRKQRKCWAVLITLMIIDTS